MKDEKEKAEELVKKFKEYADSNYGGTEFEKNWQGMILSEERKVRNNSSIKCAIIAVDEILMYYREDKQYWQCVKEELNKMLKI